MATLAAPHVSAPRTRGALTDDVLVAAVRRGDDLAFEELYERYRRRIAAFVVGRVKDEGRAEDITQDVFLSALGRLRATEAPVRFKPWVYEIAKNACVDAFRRGQRSGNEVSWDGGADAGPAAAAPDVQLAAKQDLDHLRAAFDGLPESQHQILVMRELGGLSYDEIGDRLGLTRAAVESTLFRARRRLSAEYAELSTGARCVLVRDTIDAHGRRLSRRDRHRVGRHISICDPCRQVAQRAGLDVATLARRPVRAKVAGLLPLPAILRHGWFRGGGDHAAARWSLAATQCGEPSTSTWIKGLVAAAAVALGGIGAGSGSPPADAARPGAGPGASSAITAAGGRTVGGGVVAALPAGPAAAGSAGTAATPGRAHTVRTGTSSGAPATTSSGAPASPGTAPASTPATGTAPTVTTPSSSSPTTARGAAPPTGVTAPATTTTAPAVTATGPTVPTTPQASAVAPALAPVVPAVTAAATQTVQAPRQAVAHTGTTVGQTATGVVTTAAQTVSRTGAAAGQVVSGTGAAAGQVVSGTGATAGQAVTDVTAATGQAVGGPAGHVVAGVGQAAGTAVQHTTTMVGTAVQQTTGSVGTTTTTATQAVGGTVQRATGAVSGIVGGH